MRKILILVSLLALALTIGPPALFLAGHMDLDTVKILMLIATVAWFVVTPFWMGREKKA